MPVCPLHLNCAQWASHKLNRVCCLVTTMLNWNHLLQQWKPPLPFTRLALLHSKDMTCSLWHFVYYTLWVGHNSLVNKYHAKKSVINSTTYLQIFVNIFLGNGILDSVLAKKGREEKQLRLLDCWHCIASAWS